MTPPNKPDPSSTASGRVTRVVAIVTENQLVIDDSMRSTEWEVLDVNISAGGSPDTATLVRRLDRAGRMRNRTVSELRYLTVEVWTRGPQGELDRPLFWGQMDTRLMRLTPNGESEIGTAAVRPFHFGNPLRGMLVWNEQAGDTLTVEHDAEFNPLVDGQVRDNMLYRQPTEGFPDYNLWILPESTRTATAWDQHGTSVSVLEWDLGSIVETLGKWLNAGQHYVENHRATEEEFLDAPAIKNIRLKRGQYLPQLLDAILPPYGYAWFLAHEKDEFGRITPRIATYQRGKGAKKAIKYPAVSGNATLEHSADNIDLVADLFRLSNQVRCDGSIIEKEVTLDLYRAWPEADDSTDIADMTKDESGAKALGTVWRKWAYNEGGDLCGTRTTVAPIPDSVPSFDDIFGEGEWVVRRRRIEPCLTWEDAEHSRRKPVRVLYSVDGGSTYDDINPEWGCRILQDEIGVMFTANTPPAVLVDAGDDARIRVTGVVKGDKRITHTAERQSGNPQTNEAEIVLDVSDQFHSRERLASSSFFGSGDADEQDDATAIQEFAETIRSQRESVALQSSVSLFGLHFEYGIGDIITAIEGREIKLNRLPNDEDGRYLQIVGITYDVAGQRTRLHVAPYDQ